MSKLLTVTEAAERLSVSVSCVYRLVERDKLPHHRIGFGRGAIRFTETDLSVFLEACRYGANPQPARPSRPRQLKHIKL